MAKKKRSWKKKLGKALMAGAALAGGLALAKRGKGTGLTTGKFPFSPAAGGARYPTDSARAKRLMTSNDAYSDQTMPAHLSNTMGNTRRGSVLASPKWQEHDFGLGPYDGAKKGGRAGKDFGSRGVGKAKRGFGRALKKGK